MLDKLKNGENKIAVASCPLAEGLSYTGREFGLLWLMALAVGVNE